MPKVASNQNIGDHSFYPQLATCQQAGCHVTATNFDVIGGQSAMKAGIQELRVALNNAGWLTRSEATPNVALSATELADQQFFEDHVRPTNGLTADQAGAVYNYLLLARGAGGGVHNPVYVRELIYDSVFAVTGAAPATIPFVPERGAPARRSDAGADAWECVYCTRLPFVCAVLMALLLLLGAGSASAGDPVSAEALFREGRAAMSRGEHALACQRFAESQRLDPAAGTLLNLGECKERLGKTASAWQHYREAADLLTGDERRELALARIGAIEPNLARLTVHLAGDAPAGSTAARDGTELGPASIGAAPAGRSRCPPRRGTRARVPAPRLRLAHRARRAARHQRGAGAARGGRRAGPDRHRWGRGTRCIARASHGGLRDRRDRPGGARRGRGDRGDDHRSRQRSGAALPSAAMQQPGWRRRRLRGPKPRPGQHGDLHRRRGGRGGRRGSGDHGQRG